MPRVRAGVSTHGRSKSASRQCRLQPHSGAQADRHQRTVVPTTWFMQRPRGRQAGSPIQTRLLSTPDSRLLTIIGPGGMGKSALALAAGQQMLRAAEGAFADGIFWVPLVDIGAAVRQESAPRAGR
ncbi:MAG: hypothetical protein R2911_26335 [Caldilineaceae bacterium]